MYICFLIWQVSGHITVALLLSYLIALRWLLISRQIEGFQERWRANGMEKVESKITCYHVIKNKSCAYMHWLLPKLYVVTVELH